MPVVTRALADNFDINGFVALNRQRYPCALMSTATRPDDTGATLKGNIGRYDIVFACPQQSLVLAPDKQLYYTDGGGNRLTEPPAALTFFDELARLLSSQAPVSPVTAALKQQLPFYGGWFVYLCYEMAAEVEPCLRLPSADSSLPLAMATRFPAAIIHDRINRRCQVVAETGQAHLLDLIEEDSRQITAQGIDLRMDTAGEPVTLAGFKESDAAPYLAQVETIKRYIYDGDIFQANLSRAWQVQLDGTVDDISLFSLLAKKNPSSFAALVCFDDAAIISSSPERLVSMRDGLIETRPIAGTRPRSGDPVTDAKMAAELLAHPKEQAEHIMLIDLERNDLGRVCVPGSIHVNELMALESWQHVHHIVSNIQGQCRPDKTSVDVLKAVFPGGTITGCPKVRCMEILAEQEQTARGAYTGSLGYINLDGDMDFNILIRTLVRERQQITFRAGGGIVADSEAENELAETRAKARGLLKLFQLDTEAEQP